MLSAVIWFGPLFGNNPNRFEAADKVTTRVIAAIRDLKPIDAILELDKRGFLN